MDVRHEAESWLVGEPAPLERLDSAAAACLRELMRNPAQLAQAVDDLSWGRGDSLPEGARAVLARVMLAPHPDGALVVRQLVVERSPA